MRIIEVNLEDIDPTEAKIQVDFSEVKICMVEVNAIKIHTKANIKTIAIKVIITKVIKVYIITHTEISNRAIIKANLEAGTKDVLLSFSTKDMIPVCLGNIITLFLATSGMPHNYWNRHCICQTT